MFYRRVPRTPAPTKTLAGAAIESAAAEWLQARGLIYVERNFRCRGGEIDLIMQDERTLVFVEVRLRSRVNFGSGAESVNASKQRRIIRAAHYYLATHTNSIERDCRFDVLAAKQDDAVLAWEWVQAAFYAG